MNLNYLLKDVFYKAIYEGDVSNYTILEGYGILEIKEIGLKFEGYFINDKFSGEGILTFGNGTVLKGEFRNN